MHCPSSAPVAVDLIQAFVQTGKDGAWCAPQISSTAADPPAMKLIREHYGIDPATRIALTLLSQLCDWRGALTVVRPETLIRWHRAGWKLFWRLKSRRGRPPIPAELQALIRRIANENSSWGEERISNELLLKLGIRVSPRTVNKYLPRRPRGRPRGDLHWSTFLRLRAQGIIACDFFVAVTATFRLLYVFVVIEHHSRRLIHCNVTAHPSAAWTLQQLPDDSRSWTDRNGRAGACGSRSLARLWQWSAAARLLCSIVVCMAISMFVNDTPVLVLSLPILLTVVARAKIPLSKTLMPVNCAILIGGMATTIGTSSNMLVVSSRESSASRLSTCSRSAVSWLAVDRRSHLTRLASATRRCVLTQTLFHQRAGYPLTHLH
jgi:hypothetical protein